MAGAAALIAALVALFGVTTTTLAENRRRTQQFRVDAVEEAIKELHRSLHAIRQRHLTFREGSKAGEELKEKRRDEATARNATLPAARARLKVVGLSTGSFEAAHRAVDAFSERSWDATDPDDPPLTRIPDDEIWAKMREAREQISKFTDDVTDEVNRKRKWWKATATVLAVLVAAAVCVVLSGIPLS
ncbi:hypothetical protein [Mycobacteroides chelonae]|uniref:Uncharacterized protein n=1 Tax=Mycobacteroides chelonae TaxID=1774 RepID=A0A1S1MA17_MYCCH|nr:hypothetical protein [Mycobacteroides chelonae]OHU80106.1 hypothetical protein BKG84_18640 [Mycobacteroides chelonae]QQG88841.1 hypothetical protein HBA99_17735 [Mycobacteroides chelonae]